MKTKIGTEIANVIRDSNTTYKVKGQLIFDVLNSQHTGTGATWRINTVNLQGAEALWRPPAQLVLRNVFNDNHYSFRKFRECSLCDIGLAFVCHSIKISLIYLRCLKIVRTRIEVELQSDQPHRSGCNHDISTTCVHTA